MLIDYYLGRLSPAAATFGLLAIAMSLAAPGRFMLGGHLRAIFARYHLALRQRYIVLSTFLKMHVGHFSRVAHIRLYWCMAR